jgi:hypothetical protein
MGQSGGMSVGLKQHCWVIVQAWDVLANILEQCYLFHPFPVGHRVHGIDAVAALVI